MFSKLKNFHVSADRCVDEKFDDIATASNAMRNKILMEHLLRRGRGARGAERGRDGGRGRICNGVSASVIEQIYANSTQAA